MIKFAIRGEQNAYFQTNPLFSYHCSSVLCLWNHHQITDLPGIPWDSDLDLVTFFCRPGLDPVWCWERQRPTLHTWKVRRALQASWSTLDQKLPAMDEPWGCRTGPGIWGIIDVGSHGGDGKDEDEDEDEDDDGGGGGGEGDGDGDGGLFDWMFPRLPDPSCNRTTSCFVVR